MFYLKICTNSNIQIYSYAKDPLQMFDGKLEQKFQDILKQRFTFQKIRSNKLKHNIPFNFFFV